MNRSLFNIVKIALDTNVVSYLLDGTYENLNNFIKELNSHDFVQVECSKYVVYELIEIRKLEHYIRQLYTTQIESGKQVNFSSALNYKRKWNAPELKYSDCFEDVKSAVEADLKRLSDEFDIVISDGFLHNDIWSPHKDLVLSSKISREDSMVVMASAFPDIGTPENDLIILTNDQDFYENFCGKETIGSDDVEAVFDLDALFESYSISKPRLYKLNNIPKNIFEEGGHVNLLQDEVFDEGDMKEHVTNFVMQHFKKANQELYFGEVIPCEAGNIDDLFCFRLDATELNQGLYLSVLTKELKIRVIPVSLSDFWVQEKLDQYPYYPTDDPISRGVSVKILNENGESLSDEFWEGLTENGNMIFLHPEF